MVAQDQQHAVRDGGAGDIRAAAHVQAQWHAALAEDFLACFDPATRQIVTNRMYFGWNPITTARHEWAFVAFDDCAIALLLATHEE